MTILTTVILCGLFMALVAAVERTRARNLEYLLHMERAITNELAGQLSDARDHLAKAHVAMEGNELMRLLDDAQRNAAYWQERADALLCENNTLVIDLMLTERECQYLRGFVRKQKDTAAGIVLLYGTPNPKRQLHIATAEYMP